MRKYINLLLLLVISFSCKQKQHQGMVPDRYIPQYSSKQLEQRIRKYYKSNSADSLMNFLIEWKNSIKPSTKEYSCQNDTLENIFLVFADLYKPFGFGNFMAINYFEGKQKFIVIQNEVNYAVVTKKEYRRLVTLSLPDFPNDTAYEFYRPTKKITNFRPQLCFDNAKYVYLTSEYREAMNFFLDLGSFKGDIIRNDTILSRYKFLTPTLPIVYGQWGGYWHLETFPIIDRIIFDDNFKHAAVDFRYSLEETVLQYRITKKYGHWTADNKWLKVRLE